MEIWHKDCSYKKVGILDEGMHFIQESFSMKDLADKAKEALENQG